MGAKYQVEEIGDLVMIRSVETDGDGLAKIIVDASSANDNGDCSIHAYDGNDQVISAWVMGVGLERAKVLAERMFLWVMGE